VAAQLGRAQLVDTVHLLRHVRQVEVGGEGPDQGDDLAHAQAGESPIELGCRRAAAAPSGRLAQSADFFDQIEQLRAVLADQGVAELAAEPSDISP
jgi:hypothetical protein